MPTIHITGDLGELAARAQALEAPATQPGVHPGDNLLKVDIMVHTAPLLRGLRAAQLFTDPKDEGESYTSIRLAPEDDHLTITAANALSMFITTAPLVEAAWSDAGVIDIPVWQAKEIITIYAGKNEFEDHLRITADPVRVRTVDSSGFIDMLDHNWPRRAMSEAAPDVPAILTGIRHAERDEVPPVGAALMRRIAQAANVFNRADVKIAATTSHYIFQIGPYATATASIPDEHRPEQDGADRELLDATDDDLVSEPTSQQPRSENNRGGFRLVAANPPEGTL